MKNDNINNGFYKKYVGVAYAKRFYTEFLKENIFKIVDFKNEMGFDYFKMKDNDINWWWDVEDCVIITNERPIVEDERIANIFDPNYKGYNPYLS